MTSRRTELFVLLQEVDIKNQQPNQVFAFVQFDNIRSVVHALHEMDGENLGDCKVKVCCILLPSLPSLLPPHPFPPSYFPSFRVITSHSSELTARSKSRFIWCVCVCVLVCLCCFDWGVRAFISSIATRGRHPPLRLVYFQTSFCSCCFFLWARFAFRFQSYSVQNTTLDTTNCT